MFQPKIVSFCLLLILLIHGNVSGQSVNHKRNPLPRAHAHNDYYHRRPLLDALDQGFCNVEADVFLKNHKLLVAHTFIEISPKKSLTRLYLEPLFARAKKNDGYILQKSEPFLLLIDFKSNGTESLKALNELLEPHKNHLTRLEDGEVIPGAITIVLSGNRPAAAIAKSQNRLVFLDGRLGDPVGWSNKISPLISESWNSHFKYRGFGEMNADELKKLQRIVEDVHRQKKKIRFWALPDRKAAWNVAFENDVDLINTDKLESLRLYLEEKTKQ